MAKRNLKSVACPTCNDGTPLKISVEEDAITNAKRLPVMIAVKCSRGHSLVVHVDGNFQIRDVEQAAESKRARESGIEKTRKYFESL